MKHRIPYLFICIAAMVFAACESGIIDNAVPTQNFNEPEYYIEVSQNTFVVASDGGELTLEVYASDYLSWQATTSESWVTLSQTSGKGGATLTLTVPAFKKSDVRQATVTIKAREKSASVAITQFGTSYFTTSVSQMTFPAEGNTQSLTLETNHDWTASPSDSWILVYPTSGTGSQTLRISANPNTSTDSRTGVIHFTADEHSVEVAITQEGAEPQYEEIDGHAYVDLGLPSGLLWATMNVGASSPEDYGDYFAWGETETKSTYDWSTYKWCNGSSNTLTKYNTSSGYGTVDNKTVLDLSDDAARANWGGSWRMATIEEWGELTNTSNFMWTWTSQGGHKGYKVTSKSNGNSIFLPAAGYREYTSLFEGSRGYYWSSSLNADSPYGAWYVYFNSGSVDDWSYGYRYYGRSVRPVWKEEAEPNFGVSPTNLSFDSAGGTSSLTITSNQSWAVSKDASWLTLSASSGSGDGTITAISSENTSTDSRTGTITFTAGGKSYTVSVTQSGASPAFSVTPTSLTFASDGGAKSLTITSNQSWAVSKDASWLTLSDLSGSGDGTITVTSSENTSTDSRTGTVTFTAASGKSYSVSVTQEGAEDTPDGEFNVTPTSLTFTSAGSKIWLLIITNTSWRASKDASWLTLSASSGIGDEAISVTASENTSTDNRTGTITFTAGEKNYTVSATQSGVSVRADCRSGRDE